jgi:large subunit ribosomal protein L29
MRPGDVRSYDDAQLVDWVGERRQEVFNLRFQHATGQLENTARIKEAKRDLARGLTVAHERGIDVEREARRQRNG